MGCSDLASEPLRILTAVPLCDGHDSAVMAVNQALILQGYEVVYLGYHRSVQDIVRAAIQEDVVAVGISSYNGGHLEFFREVVELLEVKGRCDIGVFGGGGGTITPADVVLMKSYGVDEIFLAIIPLFPIPAVIIFPLHDDMVSTAAINDLLKILFIFFNSFI